MLCLQTIGNHEFDDEVSGLASYLKQLRAPVVVTNIDQSEGIVLRVGIYA